MENEIWKDVPGYEGIYQVSNLGRVKGLHRVSKTSRGNRIYKENILKICVNKRGYVYCFLCKMGKRRTFPVHQLVAITFLNHKPCGHKLVVNHINYDSTDNRVINLEIVSQRQNSSHRVTKSSSNYVGVSWNKSLKKWTARITIGKEYLHLGVFVKEYDAHLAYQKALKDTL